MPKEKQSQRDLAILYQVTQPTISRLKREGCNVYDKEEFRRVILSQRKRPKAWEDGCPWDEKPATEPINYNDDEEVADTDEMKLRSDLLAATDYKEIQAIQTKIKGLKDHNALMVEQGKYIAIEEVQTDMIKIAAAMRSSLKGLRHELPATLEGLTAAQMKGKIDDKTHGIMLMLSDELNELYEEPTGN
jgi:hypothetical protein